MDVSMSSALLLRFVSRCWSGSAEVKSPLLSHDCENATIRSLTKVALGRCNCVGHHCTLPFTTYLMLQNGLAQPYLMLQNGLVHACR